MKLFKKYRGFVLTMCFLLIGQLAYSHVTRISVKQNQNGSLTWYVETYHGLGECGINNSGISINGLAYPLQSAYSGSAPTAGTVIFADAGSSWPTYYNSYAMINTPYIPGALNVQPYSSNVCWAFAVGGNGSFTPPPHVCTTPPVTSVSNTIGAPNNNNTECNATDDTIPVTLNISHLACGNITGDGQLSVFYSDGALIGNVAYQNGISTPYTFNLTQGKLAQLTIVDNDFPNSPFNYTTAVNHNASTPYTDLGASATDNCGTPNVSVGGDVVDVNTVGRYVITYDAVDTSGKNATQVTRTVNVVGIAPVIVVPEDITVNSDSGTCGYSSFINYI